MGLCLVTWSLAAAEAIEPAGRWRQDAWTAQWITMPDAPVNEYGVYHFRQQIELTKKPERFVVHVAADARYRLYVNGTSVSFGPQRSDHLVWHYDSIDLAPWLKAGANIIAAELWSYGAQTPYAIIGERTGLLIQGDGDPEQVINTNDSWKVIRNASYSPLPVALPTYIVVGPGERVEGTTYPWGWQNAEYDDHAWTRARRVGQGNPYGRGTDIDHWLRPRTIPALEESVTRFARVRRAEGIMSPDGFAEGNTTFAVAAQARVVVLLDQGCETNAFPQLTVSGGRGARVRLTYAEALVDSKGEKGHRDEVEGRRCVGVADEFHPDGGQKRLFTTLAFRTYRYVQLEIETADEPLRIDDLHGVFTGYPFKELASFRSDDPVLQRIWEVGWRTARLCAFETYMDCPYYEQLQYVGDTRIQALLSLYVTGDDRLMRNAIEQYDRSRLAEGLTQSRYPSVVPQVINTFSLYWVGMVHDYWMHRPDEAFVRERLPGMQAVLGWFERRIDPQTGLLGPLDYWTFVDWTNEWPWDNALGVGGEPPGARTGGSSIVSLLFAETLEEATLVFRALGQSDQAGRSEQLAAGLRAAVRRHCWDEKRQLLADTPEKISFSQHANALAILAGVVDGEKAAELFRRVAADQTLVQCSTYFRFYLLRAMKKAGLGDAYLAQLGPWRQMLEVGLTTFAEKPDPTRSDCHAWSASPVYELLATVCGVEPASPGFATVHIEPHLGALPRAECLVVHPCGTISVKLERKDGRLEAKIVLPRGVTGEFIWGGTRVKLREGDQEITVRNQAH